MLCAQAWKPSSQHTGEKRGVAGLLLGLGEGTVQEPRMLRELKGLNTEETPMTQETAPRGAMV